MKGRAPVERWRSLAPLRAMLRSNSRKPSASAASSSEEIFSKENPPDEELVPAAGSADLVVLVGSLSVGLAGGAGASAGEAKGSAVGGPFSASATARLARFSSASTLVT